MVLQEKTNQIVTEKLSVNKLTDAKQFFEIRFWTHMGIIEEPLRYYDQMDGENKELIPLKKIWVVNSSDE